MPGEDSKSCPVLRPTKAQFSRPFVNYVSEYFRKNPDVPIVKVIPPKGYAPRRSPYPTDLRIDTPIEQRVGGAAAMLHEPAHLQHFVLTPDAAGADA